MNTAYKFLFLDQAVHKVNTGIERLGNLRSK